MKGKLMQWREALDLLDNGKTLSVACPDGVKRNVWGYNGPTGDLFVTDWPGNVFMDCSSGELKAEFE
jgi:hypothetical protein